MQLSVLAVRVAVVIAGLHWTVAGRMARTVGSSDDGGDHETDSSTEHEDRGKRVRMVKANVTCNFTVDFCDWNNETAEGYQLQWTLEKGALDDNTQYASVDVSNKAAGYQGRLASLTLLPQKAGVMCKLRFKYCFRKGSNTDCRLMLSVYEKEEAGEKNLLWNSTDVGALCATLFLAEVYVNCTADRNLIYLDGKVDLNNNTGCGDKSEIVVTKIWYTVLGPNSSTDSTSASPTLTATPTQTSASYSSSTSPVSNSQSGGLGNGAVAAVIGVVVAVVVVAVVVVVLVLRRRRGHDGGLTICLQKINRNSSSADRGRSPNGNQGTAASTNPAFISEDLNASALQTSAVSPAGGGGGRPGKETDDGYSEVDTPTYHGYNKPDADHVYSEMDDLKPGQTHTDDGYALVNKPLKVTSSPYQVPSSVLSNQPARHLQNHPKQRGQPSLPGDQTRSNTSYDYAHVEPRNLRASKKPGQAKLPLDNAQYSLARVQNPSEGQEEATSPYYIPKATSDYEAVDDVKRPSATLSDDDGYNHIGGSADGGRQLKTAVSDDDAYNHISGPGKDDDDAYNHINGSGNGGKLAATAACDDDAYNHIRGSSEDKKEGGDDYNHIKERDEYHRLNTEQRKRDEQRELAGGDYSHIL